MASRVPQTTSLIFQSQGPARCCSLVCFVFVVSASKIAMVRKRIASADFILRSSVMGQHVGASACVFLGAVIVH